MASSKFKVALIQMIVTASKIDNFARVTKLIGEAAKAGAKIVALPECWNSPYGTQHFPEYAESIPGKTTEMLSTLAKDNNVFLVGGSIPERDGEKLFNTCTVYNETGKMVGKYRKVHLFDINIPGKISFKESSVLSPGNDYVVIDTRIEKESSAYCRIGLGICYDLRFNEMAQIYAKKGCHFLLYPGAFNMTTGPAHWELLLRSRAVDNQVYVAGISPARDEESTYIAWGHSALCSPWGDVMCKATEKEEVIYAELDLNFLEGVRNNIPIREQKRPDLYEIRDTSDMKAPMI